MGEMKITLLGSGDAIGTPKIGCRCPVCSQAIEEGLERVRTSLLVEYAGRHILIDTSPDLRRQLLTYGEPEIDAVIWTHGHYDHISGFGEFYRVQKLPVAYAAPPVLDYVKSQFHYLSFRTKPVEVYRPADIFGLQVTLVPVCHPPIYACGVIIEHEGSKIVFTGDTNSNLPAASLEAMKEPDLIFIDAIVPPGFSIGKHMNTGQASSVLHRLGAKEYRFVHMSHLMPWDCPGSGRDGEVFHYP